MANAWVLVGIVAIFGFLGAYIYFTQFCETCKGGTGTLSGFCAQWTQDYQCNSCPNCEWVGGSDPFGYYCVQKFGTSGCGT